MRNLILIVLAVFAVALASTDAYALGGRRGGGQMAPCNMGQVLQLQAAPTQATQQDLLSIPAPKTVSVKPQRYLVPTKTASGLEISGLAKLNGNVPLGSAFSNVAAK